MTEKRTYSFKLEPEIKAQAEEKAKEKGWTFSHFIRDLIKTSLKDKQ